MAYQKSTNRGRKTSNYGGGSNQAGFNSVQYDDRPDARGEQGTKGAYGQGKGPRIVGTPGPKAA